MALIPKPTELSTATLNLFNSIVKKEEDDSPQKSNKYQIFPHLLTNKKIFYKVQDGQKTNQINFKNLEWLIDTTQNKEIEQSHLDFMDNYWKIFAKDPPRTSKNESPRVNVFDRLYGMSKQDLNKQKRSGDEPDHLKPIRVAKKTTELGLKNSYEEYEKERIRKFKRLRNIVKKYPFERTDEENKQICEIICEVDDLMEMIPPVLRNDKKFRLQFSSCAVFESVNLKHSQVFGNFGFHLVLKGSVRPLSVPHLNRNQTRFDSATPEPMETETQTLNIGDCFGTLTELPGKEITTRMFRVLTLEDKCEFLKISIESFRKISKKIFEEDREEKLNAIKSCPAYTSWPKHSLEELINVFEWRDFSANTILTNEGFLAPFIGFINKGECHVLRKVDISVDNKKSGQTEKQVKQVVVGKLKPHESFGEFSCLLREPMTCTVVTETRSRIGVITYDKCNKLANITQRLLIQTATRTFADLTQKEIHERHIREEKRKMWKEYKSLIVEDTIHKYGIVPGRGKYEIPKIETRFNKDE